MGVAPDPPQIDPPLTKGRAKEKAPGLPGPSFASIRLILGTVSESVQKEILQNTGLSGTGIHLASRLVVIRGVKHAALSLSEIHRYRQGGSWSDRYVSRAVGKVLGRKDLICSCCRVDHNHPAAEIKIHIKSSIVGTNQTFRPKPGKQARVLYVHRLGRIGVAHPCGIPGVIAIPIYGIGPYDIPSYVGMTAIILGAAALAGFIPARRASRTDPVLVFRKR